MSINDTILEQSVKEYQAALKYRQSRVTSSWHPNEDLYYGRKSKKLKGRHNVLLGEMQGFVETLLSKVDDPPLVRFEPQSEADMRKADKVSAAWDIDSSPTHGDWRAKDLLGKKMAALYGRCIMKYFAESAPKYKSNLVLIDPYDFLIDPMAGGESIEDAEFMGQDNIFKSVYDLEEDERYDQRQVEIVKMSMGRDKENETDNTYQEKGNRDSILGYRTAKYRSEETVNMVEWYTTYKGERYICAFDRVHSTWLRIEKLSDIFETAEYPNGDPLWPFDSWAFYPDPFEFWTPSPADQVRDTIAAKSILLNQALDNRQYRNFGMKAYDTRVFKNPALLEPRWGGIVPATPDSGKDVRSGIYEFQYPDVGDTTNLYNLVDSTQARASGITASIQGQAEEDKKVGVFEGEVAQASDRLGLFEKSYGAFWIRMGKRWVNGLKEHLREKMAIKMLGTRGLEWSELIREDLGEYDIVIQGLNAELFADARKRKTKLEVLAANLQNPNMNPRLSLEKLLETSGFEKYEIKELLDTANEGDQEILAEAAEENEMMLKKDAQPNRGATTAHIQKHIDFSRDEDLKPEVVARVMAHANAEMDFARKNLAKKVFEERAQAGALPGFMPEATGDVGEMVENIPATPLPSPERQRLQANTLPA